MTAADRAAEGIRARFAREAEQLHSEGFLTVDDAAALLHVGRDTVTRMTRDGRLHATKVGDRTVTRREWIEEMPPGRTPPATPPRSAQAERHRAAAAWRRERGWLSVREAASLAGITPAGMTVRIRKGTLPAVRAGDGTPVPGMWLIRAEDVQPRRAA